MNMQELMTTQTTRTRVIEKYNIPDTILYCSKPPPKRVTWTVGEMLRYHDIRMLLTAISLDQIENTEDQYVGE